jgi:hypothetical protein
MPRTYFEEEQSFRQNPLLRWILPPAVALVILPFLYGLYWQLIMNEPWGEKPMNDQALVLVSMFVFLVVGMVLWMLWNTKLELKISDDGMHYRYYPIVSRWKFISKEMIKNYEVKKLGFFELGKRGYHKGILTKRERLVIRGRNVLKLRISSDKEIIIGTVRPEELQLAMNKLMSTQKF